MSVKAKADAIDRFVRTLKSGGLYDDINAACIMAGWTNLAGALTPLKGSAPTNNGFLAADLDAGIGLKGNGSSKNLATGRAQNADPQDSKHMSVYAASPGSTDLRFYMGSGGTNWSGMQSRLSGTAVQYANNSTTISSPPTTYSAGLLASSRSSSSSFSVRSGGAESTFAATSGAPPPDSVYVFDRLNANLASNATLSWYSIGSATDLAALDSAVSTLMEDLRSIDEAGFDPSALAYIRAVEAADGAYLETGVKKAINRFIVGLKKDNLWDAIKASCILCGARTIAGALVPLAGTAPTAYNFTSAQYNRETGLIGVPASATYIDTNRANNADPQDDQHMVVYKTDATSEANPYYVGAFSGSSGSAVGEKGMYANSTATFAGGAASGSDVGLHGFSRTASNVVAYKRPAYGVTTSNAASNSHHSLTNVAFAIRTSGGSVGQYTGSRFAFYSIGTSLDLSKIGSRVSTLVSEIAAAIP